jgi:hypothetical protein
MGNGVKVTEDEDGQFVDEKKGKKKKKGLRDGRSANHLDTVCHVCLYHPI